MTTALRSGLAFGLVLFLWACQPEELPTISQEQVPPENPTTAPPPSEPKGPTPPESPTTPPPAEPSKAGSGGAEDWVTGDMPDIPAEIAAAKFGMTSTELEKVLGPELGERRNRSRTHPGVQYHIDVSYDEQARATTLESIVVYLDDPSGVVKKKIRKQWSPDREYVTDKKYAYFNPKKRLLAVVEFDRKGWDDKIQVTIRFQHYVPLEIVLGLEKGKPTLPFAKKIAWGMPRAKVRETLGFEDYRMGSKDNTDVTYTFGFVNSDENAEAPLGSIEISVNNYDLGALLTRAWGEPETITQRWGRNKGTRTHWFEPELGLRVQYDKGYPEHSDKLIYTPYVPIEELLTGEKKMGMQGPYTSVFAIVGASEADVQALFEPYAHLGTPDKGMPHMFRGAQGQDYVYLPTEFEAFSQIRVAFEDGKAVMAEVVGLGENGLLGGDLKKMLEKAFGEPTESMIGNRNAMVKTYPHPHRKVQLAWNDVDDNWSYRVVFPLRLRSKKAP